MNLINEEITHKVFGEGNIVEHEGSIITVDFNEEIRKFVYPDAIGKFIKLNDPNTAKTFKKVMTKRQEELEALEREREEERLRQELEEQRRERLKNLKIHDSSQIVFWLDEEEQQQVFTDWHVSTGVIQSGKNKGQPNKAARLRPNSASVLTVREPDQAEEERRILGIYMVHETFSGDLSEDGLVPAHTDYRIMLTEEESAKMLFWNYYINKSYPERIAWNSGKFRYFDNLWTAQILKDLIALRTDEESIKQAESFLEYFCRMNVIEMDDIPEASGALKR